MGLGFRGSRTEIKESNAIAQPLRVVGTADGSDEEKIESSVPYAQVFHLSGQAPQLPLGIFDHARLAIAFISPHLDFARASHYLQ